MVTQYRCQDFFSEIYIFSFFSIELEKYCGTMRGMEPKPKRGPGRPKIEGPRSFVGAYIPKTLADAARRDAVTKGQSYSTWLERAIMAAVEKKEAGPDAKLS